MVRERVEKLVQNFEKGEVQEYLDYLKHPWRIFWANFLAGTARGLGFLIGAAIVLTILGYVLREVLVNIPLVGKFFAAIQHWIDSTIQNGAPQIPSSPTIESPPSS